MLRAPLGWRLEKGPSPLTIRDTFRGCFGLALNHFSTRNGFSGDDQEDRPKLVLDFASVIEADPVTCAARLVFFDNPCMLPTSLLQL